MPATPAPDGAPFSGATLCPASPRSLKSPPRSPGVRTAGRVAVTKSPPRRANADPVGHRDTPRVRSRGAVSTMRASHNGEQAADSQ